MEDSIFIAVLKHGEDVGLDGTSELLLGDYIQKKMSIDFNEENHKHIIAPLHRLFHECFEAFDEGMSGRNHILKTEYYFRLIEYRELQESRTAAKAANKHAMWAIGISVAAVIACAVLTFTQLNTPVSMNKSDLQSLINSNTAGREIKLDSLQMSKILSVLASSRPAVKNKGSLPSNEVGHHELINKYYEEE